MKTILRQCEAPVKIVFASRTRRGLLSVIWAICRFQEALGWLQEVLGPLHAMRHKASVYIAEWKDDFAIGS